MLLFVVVGIALIYFLFLSKQSSRFICGKGVKSAHHQKSANQGEERKGKEEENEGQRDGESEESKRERFKKFLRNKMGKEE